MTLLGRSTHEIFCTAQVAENCRKTQTVVRERRQNDTVVDFVVPPGWVETKAGMLCPECAAVTP